MFFNVSDKSSKNGAASRSSTGSQTKSVCFAAYITVTAQCNLICNENLVLHEERVELPEVSICQAKLSEYISTPAYDKFPISRV